MKKHLFFLRIIVCMLLACLVPYLGEAYAADNDAARAGSCTIVSGGQTYRPSGCLIKKGKDDNLSWLVIERKNGHPLLEEILTISVVEMSPGTAEVSGLTKGGINSRWGEARFDGKCWNGDDFRICTD